MISFRLQPGEYLIQFELIEKETVMKRNNSLDVKIVVVLLTLITGIWTTLLQASEHQAGVPEYVISGLQAYKDRGYEEAVKIWLAGSPFASGTAMVSRISFFKNIEMLGGPYKSHDFLMVKETGSSNVVYVRMNYERLPGYILFTSGLRDGQWVLTNIKLDRMQRFGTP